MKIKFSKNNIILVLAVLISTANCTFAAPFWEHANWKHAKTTDPNAIQQDEYGQKVISDKVSAAKKKQQDKDAFIQAKQKEIRASKKSDQKEIQEELDNINSYSDRFFTSVQKQKVQKRIETESIMNQLPIESQGISDQSSGTIAPVKRLRLNIKKWQAQKSGVKAEPVTQVEEPKNQAILNCDLMQYYADKTELEADGNASLYFPKNNSTLKADKITYNQASNIIQATGHVVIIKEGKEIYGDFMNIDMNEENSFMDNPETQVFEILSHAKKGYMYGDKIIQENGNLLVNKHTIINLKSEFFGPDLSQMIIADKDKSFYKKDCHGREFRIDTNDLIINSTKEHDTITLNHASVFFHDKKVGTIPTITVHTNKAQDYAEANYPEFGTMMNLGAFVGPGFDFDTPRGTNLKLIPILNYQSHGDNSSENSLGWGGIAKFKSATNKTDIAYGTANKIFIMRGKQRLDDNLWFQYATNSYMDDWFMGFRMPKAMGELIYEDIYPIKNVLGKNEDFTYTQRIAAGYMQDIGGDETSLLGNEGGLGTARFKYMGEAAQTIYNYVNEDHLLSARLQILGQGSAAVYGTGNTQTVARIGPMLHTQYKYWMQDLGYFLSGYNDDTPFIFDRYVYGRSNVMLRESLRVSKYVTLSWFGSLNLSGDAWNNSLMQENSFFVSFGPDDIKVNLGYDTIRQQTYLTLALNVDAKGTKVNYKKMVIKNPEKIGKSENSENSVSRNFMSGEAPEEEKAEVIDIDTSKEAI